MTRPLNFRCWDLKEKTWTDFECFIGEQYCGLHEKFEDVIVQQFTGFLDRKGREIYEGDIIGGDYTLNSMFVNAAIEFKFGKFVDSKFGYGLDFLAGDNYRNSQLKIYEVIGNIFENPEIQ